MLEFRSNDAGITGRPETTIARCTRGGAAEEIESLPKQIAEIEKKLDAHTRKLDVDRNVMAGNQKERKASRRRYQGSRAEDLEVAGSDAAGEDQRSIPSLPKRDRILRNRNSEIEDRILDLMGEAEPLENNAKTAEAALKEEKAKVEAEKQRPKSELPRTKNFCGKR